jgi:hypothetical protein
VLAGRSADRVPRGGVRRQATSPAVSAGRSPISPPDCKRWTFCWPRRPSPSPSSALGGRSSRRWWCLLRGVGRLRRHSTDLADRRRRLRAHRSGEHRIPDHRQLHHPARVRARLPRPGNRAVVDGPGRYHPHRVTHHRRTVRPDWTAIRACPGRRRMRGRRSCRLSASPQVAVPAPIWVPNTSAGIIPALRDLTEALADGVQWRPTRTGALRLFAVEEWLSVSRPCSEGHEGAGERLLRVGGGCPL